MNRAQRRMGSAALVLGLILVAASVALIWISLFHFEFVKPGVNNRVREDSRIE